MSACVSPTRRNKNPKFPLNKQFNNPSHNLSIPMEPKTPEWSCSEVLTLIREYGNRPTLWDPDCEDYKNRFKKHQQWMELAVICRCSKLEVERKMKILNSQYRRERLKAVRMRIAGLPHRITWYGYKAFGFMNKQLVRCKNRSTLMAGEIKQEEEEQDEFGSGGELIPFLDEDDDGGAQDNQSGVSDSQSYLHDNELSTEVKDEGLNGETSQMKDHSGAASGDLIKVLYDKDEWALFGDLVAHAFRKLPDDRMRCIMKHKINTVLYEAELASYGDSLSYNVT